MSKPSALSTIIAELEAELAVRNADTIYIQKMIARLKTQQKPKSKPRVVPSAKEAS